MDVFPVSAALRAADNVKNKSDAQPGDAQFGVRSGLRTRKYDVVYLNKDAEIIEFSRIAPAISAFEDAFGALGRGAILQTKNGPMSVEDVLPGDDIRLANGTYEKLLWLGSMTLRPTDHENNPDHGSLTRVTADALGLNRPSPDLVLGPTARLLHRAAGVRTLTGRGAAFIPARDFFDGANFIALRPATSVQVYQLGFDKHLSSSVNGIEIESLHPGTAFALGLRGDMLQQYLALFPHKKDFEDFGDMKNPRLRLRDLELLD